MGCIKSKAPREPQGNLVQDSNINKASNTPVFHPSTKNSSSVTDTAEIVEVLFVWEKMRKSKNDKFSTQNILRFKRVMELILLVGALES